MELGNLTIHQCEQSDLPAVTLDPDDHKLDPFVGKPRNPVYFAIYLDQTPIGNCMVYNAEQDSIEFGILLSKEFRNKGYGSEAVRLLSDYYLSVLGFSRVHLKVLPSNSRAIRSYEKAGFKKCGRIVVDSIEFIKMERRI